MALKSSESTHWTSAVGYCHPGDTWRCLTAVLAVPRGIEQAEGKDAPKCLVTHRTTPTAKNDLTPNVNGPETERLCSGKWNHRLTRMFKEVLHVAPSECARRSRIPVGQMMESPAMAQEGWGVGLLREQALYRQVLKNEKVGAVGWPCPPCRGSHESQGQDMECCGSTAWGGHGVLGIIRFHAVTKRAF